MRKKRVDKPTVNKYNNQNHPFVLYIVRNNLFLKDVASTIGVSEACISSWCNNHYPSAKHFKKVVGEYGKVAYTFWPDRFPAPTLIKPASQTVLPIPIIEDKDLPPLPFLPTNDTMEDHWDTIAEINPTADEPKDRSFQSLLELKQFIVDMGYENVVLLDTPAYVQAFIGIDIGDHAIYDYDLMIVSLMKDGMTYEDASEFVNYNTIRALPYMGEHGPIVMFPYHA